MTKRLHLFLFVFAASAALVSARIASAQGCEPIRYTAPVKLGGGGDAYQPDGEWQLTLAYRRLVSNDWFVGTKENSALAPGGSSPVFRIHTLVAHASYALSDRLRVSASLPFSKGSLARTWPDGAFHTQHATGIGDITVSAESWLLSPRQNEIGNVAFGAGLKLPTGSHSIASQYYGATAAVDFPADQTIQPGDGGVAIVLQARAFRQVADRTHLYAFGSYMISPKAESEIVFAPNSKQHWSVPDVYSAKLGAAYSLFPDAGVTASLGARIDGIPIHDLVGGGDELTIKRTSYVVFADPGLSVTHGKDMLTIGVPYRLMVNRQKSLWEQQSNSLNAGGFAKFLVFLAYTRRL